MTDNIGSVLARIRDLAESIAATTDIPSSARDAAKAIVGLTSPSTDIAGETSDIPQTDTQSI